MKYQKLFNLTALLGVFMFIAGHSYAQSTVDTLIQKKSVWKYLDDGSDQYGIFESPSFDDSLWAEGPGRLGYGGDGETTVLSFGPDGSNKYITYYFRKTITLDDPTKYKALLMNLTRDDGAVVFVNGVEVVRDNMPAGSINYMTFSSTTISGSGESVYYPFYLPLSAFTQGENVIAVAIHNRDGFSSDLGFDMEFIGFTEGANIQFVHNSSDISIKEVSAFYVNSQDTILINSNFKYLQATSFFEVALETAKIVICPAGYTQLADVIGEQTFSASPGFKQTLFLNGVVLRPVDMKAEGEIVIPNGSVWKYLDNGSNQGTAWTSPTFDDASWASGPAPLGYGRSNYTNGGTTVSFGPSSTNKYITTYFRSEFNIDDLSDVAACNGSVFFDDGVVIYVNGVEVTRRNMAAGTVLHTTRANATVGSSGSTAAFSIPLNLLVQGKNVITASVHQDAPSSSDIVFNANIQLVFGKMLMPRGSVWKYLDDGSEQGTTWVNADFNDSTWNAGPAELGYGDGGEATVVSFGPNSSDKFPCTYFRSTFEVADPSILGSMKFLLLRDDGAVVYLNGVEVVRDNMPSGDITSKTYANGTVDGNNERTYFEFSVSPDLLIAGTNTLAVTIHQDRPTSSDISFDLEIIGKEKGTFWVNPNGVALGAGVTPSQSNADVMAPVKGLSFVNGVTDAAAYSLSIVGGMGDKLASNIPFKSSASITGLLAEKYTFRLSNMNGQQLFGVDLREFADSNVVFFTTGFYNLDKNEIDSTSLQATLAMVTGGGRVILLEKPIANLVFVNNSSDVNTNEFTLTIRTEGGDIYSATASQFNFSNMVQVPASEELTFELNGNSLSTNTFTYLDEFVVILNGVGNSANEYAENIETMEDVNFSLSFFSNPMQENWFTQNQNTEINAVLFQGVTDAPYLSIGNVAGTSFFSEDIALNENSGIMTLDASFDYIAIKSVSTQEIHSVFTVEANNDSNQTWLIFTKGFYSPELNPTGAEALGIWGFNASGERSEWSQPMANLQVVNLSADTTLSTLSVSIDGTQTPVGFREISTEIPVRAFIPHTLTLADSSVLENINLVHSSEPSFVLVYGGTEAGTLPGIQTGEGIHMVLLTPEAWSALPTKQILNTVSAARNFTTTFYQPSPLAIPVVFNSIDELTINPNAVNIAFRTEVSPTENYFHSLPANLNGHYLLISSGVVNNNLSYNSNAAFAWNVLTIEGEWLTLSDTIDVRLSVNNVFTSQSGLVVYPNPVRDLLQIQTDSFDFQITLTNTLGQVVYTGNSTTVDVSNLQSGMYIITLTDLDTQSVVNTKVIVE